MLCFIGVPDAEVSEQRVAMRVSQGGHDVPTDKLRARYPRAMANLKAALRDLPHVLIYDNDDMSNPFRKVAEFKNGRPVFISSPVPEWLDPLIVDI